MSKRPLRDRFSDSVDKVPRGPLGKVGDGNLVGGAGFLAVESTRPFIDFIPGVKQPGYNILAHSTERFDGGTTHTLTITAVSEEVAEFVAKYAATPSNWDYITAETEIKGKEVLEEQRGYNTWKITVRVSSQGEI